MTYSEIMETIRQIAGRLIRFAPVAGNSADGNGDSIEGRKSKARDPDNEYRVRRMFPFGIRSRPPKGTDGLVVFVNGGPANGVLLAAESSRFGPSNLNDGETALYNKVVGCTILLDQSGAITLTDKSGATVKLDGTGNIILTPAIGKTAQVAGAGHPLPLWDTFLTDLATFISDILVGTVGGPTKQLPANATSIAAFLTKVQAATYNSTVASNG